MERRTLGIGRKQAQRLSLGPIGEALLFRQARRREPALDAEALVVRDRRPIDPRPELARA
ncbi:MAG: hypothetical protein ACRELB_27275 [Polyangiaceae bacterium]